MTNLRTAAFAIAAMLAASPAGAAQTSAASASMAPTAAPAAAGLPTLRHLVYEFGYNTKAASQGNNTGTTTIDIGGLASDGGMMVTATDSWWNTVHPKQSSTCEVYANGGVTCSKPPYSLTVMQSAVVPLLGQSYFSALSAGLNSSWKQDYNVRATFSPGISTGFAGQVYTWNCAFVIRGKGHDSRTAAADPDQLHWLAKTARRPLHHAEPKRELSFRPAHQDGRVRQRGVACSPATDHQLVLHRDETHQDLEPPRATGRRPCASVRSPRRAFPRVRRTS